MIRISVAATAVVSMLTLQANSQVLQRQPIGDKASRIELINEYIRELGVLNELQQTAKRELREDSGSTGQLVTGVRVGTRTIFEMNTSILKLDQIKLTGQWNDFRSYLKDMDEQRISFVREMSDGAKKLLSGPEPGVNYGELTARAPELTASVEQLDKMIFEMSKVMFLGLVDEERVGSDGQLHHLIVTKKQRNDMIRSIDLDFGSGLKNLKDEKATHIVNAAWAMRYGLTLARYHSSDEE